MGVTFELSQIAEAAGWASLDPETLSLAETGQEPSFPGAVVPARTISGTTVYYALAPDGPAWRRLQPLLLAFAGPTITDFEGAPADLDQAETLEQLLAQANFYAVARLRPARSTEGAAIARRALLRLRHVLSTAPNLSAAQPQSTSRLLARLQDALNDRDLPAAWHLHETLKSELRLDAINLLQLEMAIHGAVGDWSAIRWHPRFEQLCASGPPAATAELLLEALYSTEFSSTDTAEQATLIRLYNERVRPYAEFLLPLATPTSTPAVDRIRDIARASKRDSEVAAAPPPVTPAKTTDPASPLDEARAALLEVTREPNDGARVRRAAGLVQALTDDQRTNLLEPAWFRAIWREIEIQLGAAPPPCNWLEWLAQLSIEHFNSSTYARQAAANWRLADADLDPTEATRLALAIEAVPDGLADERLTEAMPYWVAWVKSDPFWPRSALRPVYSALLLRIALSARRGAPSLRSGAFLLESLLQIGLSGAEYRETIDAIQPIAVDGLNRNTVYDVLEYLDLLIGSGIPDRPVLDRLLSLILPPLRNLGDHFSAGQRSTLNRILAWSGWPAVVPPTGPAITTEAASPLSGQRIAIYTLTESAGRQAQSALAEIAPDAVVDLNHDLVGTRALAGLAATADIFVIVWSSAKHAATDFIKEHRNGKPVLYANGRGASSILRVIEENALRESHR